MKATRRGLGRRRSDVVLAVIAFTSGIGALAAAVAALIVAFTKEIK